MYVEPRLVLKSLKSLKRLKSLMVAHDIIRVLY